MADSIRQEDLAGMDLASLRLLVNCSEPVRQPSHDRFLDRFRTCGLRETALAACYAMAETTFAVTQTRPAERARSVDASREELSRGRYVPPQPGESLRQCVSSGVPIPGCRVRIVGEIGEEVPEGEVGEIAISSVSMFTGYRNNPEETARVLRDGWYFSGDYGFRWEGELSVIGRKKDLIIVAGKDIYPEDVEDAVGGVAGVLPGRVVAFGLEDERAGTEQICVVAETAVEDEAGRKTLARAIIAAGMLIDVTVARVYLVSPRWLIKSSAGKPSRSANRERALQDMKPVA
jgi:acyl-CoA synthetase (AMP-forming)/AMP-acid ligase II